MITIRLESPIAAIVYCETLEEAEVVLAVLRRPREQVSVESKSIQVLQARPRRVQEVVPAPETASASVLAEEASDAEHRSVNDELEREFGRKKEKVAPAPVHASPLAASHRPDWLPPLRHKNGAVYGLAKAIRAAFLRDESFNLPELAGLIYGESSGRTLNLLKVNIRNMCARGSLKQKGASRYIVSTETEEPDEG